MQEGQGAGRPLPNIYGLDYNAALRDFMDTPASSGEIRRLRNEYLTFCSLGYKEAESTMAEIKSCWGARITPYSSKYEKTPRRMKYIDKYSRHKEAHDFNVCGT